MVRRLIIVSSSRRAELKAKKVQLTKNPVSPFGFSRASGPVLARPALPPLFFSEAGIVSTDEAIKEMFIDLKLKSAETKLAELADKNSDLTSECERLTAFICTQQRRHEEEMQAVKLKLLQELCQTQALLEDAQAESKSSAKELQSKVDELEDALNNSRQRLKKEIAKKDLAERKARRFQAELLLAIGERGEEV